MIDKDKDKENNKNNKNEKIKRSFVFKRAVIASNSCNWWLIYLFVNCL